MTREDALQLLRTRSALTSQPYGDGAIDAWHDALADRSFEQCRTALVTAARTHQKVTVAHVVEQLPPAQRSPITPPEQCELCDNTGWVDAPSREWPNERTSTQVKPCRCTRGQQMIETQRRILEANRR